MSAVRHMTQVNFVLMLEKNKHVFLFLLFYHKHNGIVT